MDIANKIKNLFGSSQKINNASTSGVSGNEFLRRGGRPLMVDNSSVTSMSDVDFYSGYSYAAINNRANKVAQLAIENLKTNATKKLKDSTRKSGEIITHPYLTLIDESNDFTNTQFWYDISTYLDLEGVYYLMAVRTVTPSLVGNIQFFKMTSPYEIRRVLDAETREVGGYIETRDGMVREIPPQMIIPIKKLNPFSRDKNFAMTDAAKDSQYTLRQAGDFTRSSLKNNISAPGILSTDILMEREMFENFQARVVSQEKGLPLFGNGAGAINWDPMQIDMDKAALLDVTKISRDQLFAVAGVSPSTLGIDEAGTTRDVSKTQKEKFIEDHIMPQLQMIIDALNQDYKKYYKSEYEENKYKITIDNPLNVDKEAESKDISIANDSYKLYDQLVADGYDRETASKYAEGEIGLDELGDPTNESRPNPIVETTMLKSGETPQNPNLKAQKDDKKSVTDQTTLDEKKALKKKNMFNYLKKNGIEKFVEKYDGKLTLEELSEYLEVV